MISKGIEIVKTNRIPKAVVQQMLLLNMLFPNRLNNKAIMT